MCRKFIVLFAIVLNLSYGTTLKEVFRWKRLDFEGFDTQQDGVVNIVPFGASHYRGRFFITMPRRSADMPITLAYVDWNDLQRGDRSPILKAYPDVQTNTLPVSDSESKDRIISVYRTKVDACSRLWFVDTGILPGSDQVADTNDTQIQSPSIWVIDLKSNQRIRRYELPSALRSRPEGMVTITLDIDPNDCSKTFAYIANMRSFGVIVYDFERNHAWGVKHNYFYIDPFAGDMQIAGFEFQWDDGVFSVALGPRGKHGYRWAYFHSMASLNEFRVSTQILQTESLATREYHFDNFQYVGQRAWRHQTNVHDIDVKSGIMLYNLVQQNAVGCWNLRDEFTPQNQDIVYQNNRTMIYPSDMKIDPDRNLIVLASSAPIFWYSRLNPNEYNFRIWLADVDSLVRGSTCDRTRNFNKGFKN